MNSHPTAKTLIGLPIQDLDTPALLIDKAAMEGNLRRMADFFRNLPAKLRPHFKNHKCTELARRQLAAGSAVGMTCAKLGEAEVLASAGFDDVLIANQVVSARKLERLVRVAKRIQLRVAVDHLDHIVALSEAASCAGITIGVLIEVDIGMGRCGAAPGEPVLQLAREVVKRPGLRFDGLQAFEGHLVSIVDAEERRRRVTEAMQRGIDTRRLIERDGIPVETISGGASATYAITGVMDGIDQIQAGTYVTMDCSYRRVIPEFEQALSILTRVISRSKPGVSVLDVGVKGAGHEFGLPQIKGHPEIEIPFFGAEEHCVIKNTPDWRIGQAVELIPSHACTTCNLYRQFYMHEKGRIVDIWPIEASGLLT
ncbi:MAG: DSD1 family PLP-dependent enzyme [Verrucomicrobia bacterium]|nr:DSD1 family PLP-dependent enzyme [Verrucomicrobiota bacterium]